MDKARIPVKLHRRVCLIQTEDAILAEELLALAPEAGVLALPLLLMTWLVAPLPLATVRPVIV